MKHISASLMTADAVSLHTAAWLPDQPPRALVIIVHGYGEHIMRYTHVAEALAEAGYAVYGLDHRGHGKSAGLRAYLPDFGVPVDDLRQYSTHITAQHGGTKLFLYGHSMGSLIALGYALRYQTELAGLALSGCAVNADDTVPMAVVRLGRFVKSFAPTFPLIPALPSTELSTDPRVAEAYDADPLVYRGLWRVGMGIGILEEGQRLRAQATQLTLPLLLLHGEADKITPLAGSRLIYERARATDKQFITYPGMRHEVMNERERAQPMSALIEWLNNH